MEKKELIKVTKDFLKNISTIKEDMKKLDPGGKLSLKRLQLKHFIQAIQTFSEDDQKLIIYKYFENKKDTEIARIIQVEPETIRRRLDKLILGIGRIIFGFEDAFFRDIGLVEYEDNKTDHQVLMEILG